MADTVRGVEYHYVTVLDAPGEGQRILSALKESGVNLVAYLGFPLGGGQSQLDLVPDDSEVLRDAAERAGITLSEAKRAFLIQGDDRVGAAAETTLANGASALPRSELSERHREAEARLPRARAGPEGGHWARGGRCRGVGGASPRIGRTAGSSPATISWPTSCAGPVSTCASAVSSSPADARTSAGFADGSSVSLARSRGGV